MADEHTKDSANQNVQVPLRLRVSGRFPSVYAHILSVYPSDHEVLLSFFEVIPPAISPQNPEQMKMLEDTGINAECVARVTIASERFLTFVDTMNQIADRMRPHFQAIEEGESNADTEPNNQEG